MKTSEILYKAADVIQRTGFSADTRYLNGLRCGCFLNAVTDAVVGSRSRDACDMFYYNSPQHREAERCIERIAGVDLTDADEMREYGWTDGSKRDAVAALEIAADIAAAEGD